MCLFELIESSISDMSKGVVRFGKKLFVMFLLQSEQLGIGKVHVDSLLLCLSHIPSNMYGNSLRL